MHKAHIPNEWSGTPKELLAIEYISLWGVAAIWKLHQKAAAVYRRGDGEAASVILDTADTAESLWEQMRQEYLAPGSQQYH